MLSRCADPTRELPMVRSKRSPERGDVVLFEIEGKSPWVLKSLEIMN